MMNLLDAKTILIICPLRIILKNLGPWPVASYAVPFVIILCVGVPAVILVSTLAVQETAGIVTEYPVIDNRIVCVLPVQLKGQRKDDGLVSAFR